MTEELILFHNTMRIRPGHLAEYRHAIEVAVDFVERNGPQLMVQTFVDEQAMVGHSFQLYRDSAAVLEHWKLSDPYIQAVMRHCVVERFEVFGDPDRDVRDGLGGADFEVTIHPRLAGFLR